MSNLDAFNAHQADARARADFLAKSVFLLAGGALTVSIGLFHGKDAPTVTGGLQLILMGSWWALFASIALFTITLLAILVRDYRFGEQWRRQLNGGPEADDRPGLADAFAWLLGSAGLIFFLGGFGGLAYVATALLPPA